MAKQSNILEAGSFAFYDSFGGLLRCKVLKITGTSGPCNSSQLCDVQITGKGKAGYKRGEVLHNVWALHVIPRNAVHVRCGQYRIGRYLVETN